jgi:predicted metal-dependent hydrolase
VTENDIDRDIALGDRRVPLTIRRHRRARRMNLRIDPCGDGVIVTLPRSVPIRDGLDFVRSQAGWIVTRLATQAPRQPFVDGAVIPYLGIEHRIVHCPHRRGATWREDGRILVAGRTEHVPRRVRDWLRAEARRELGARARAKAARIDRRIARVTVRDTISRWGSCTSDGRLSFSWRLILAPEPVLDYVVAHEVAHLAELNHGPRFRTLLSELTERPATAEAWLRRSGARLHRYG